MLTDVRLNQVRQLFYIALKERALGRIPGQAALGFGQRVMHAHHQLILRHKGDGGIARSIQRAVERTENIVSNGS